MKTVGGWEGCCQSPDFKLHGRIGEKLQLLSEIDSTTAQLDKLSRRSAEKKNPKPVGFFCLNQRPCYETVVLLVSSFAVWHKHYQSVDSGSDNLVFQPLINKHKFPQKMQSNFVLCTFFKLILCFLVRRINRIQQEKGFLCGWDSKKGCVHLLHSLRIQGHRGAFGVYILALNGTGKATPGFVVFFL